MKSQNTKQIIAGGFDTISDIRLHVMTTRGGPSITSDSESLQVLRLWF